MKRNPPEQDTIAAIGTAPGESAIGIVRLSGPKAVPIVDGLFHSASGKRLVPPRRRVYYGEIRDGQRALDEVLVNVMPAPHSYTREDVVEVNCHGGAAPVRAVLEAVLSRGARPAGPGEFTRRAFLNGRLDLIQAEAVIDRIRAGTKAALRAAAAAGSGRLSRGIHALADTLTDALARVEAAADFPEEDLPELVDDALRQRLEQALATMRELLATANAGRLYREGAAAAIAGRPNVGKSSLFNALLRDARAIVTAEPGTTRDLIEETITIQGIPVRLRDTAGLREASGEAERHGVAMAKQALAEADLILCVMDASVSPADEDAALAHEITASGLPAVLVWNKQDLPGTGAPAPAWTQDGFAATVRVSAKTGDGLHALEQAMAHILLGDAAIQPGQGLITRVHQQDSLRRAAEALERVLAGFESSPEFLSVDLRESLAALGEITGETTPEQVLDRIFAAFCIGK